MEHLNNFDKEIKNIRNEFSEKERKSKEEYINKKKHENIHLLTSEKDFFKDESIRLNGLCKALSEKNEELFKENKLYKIELEGVCVKWKESEKINKQLLIELEKVIELNQELENKLALINNKNLDNDMYKNKEDIKEKEIENSIEEISNDIVSNSNCNNKEDIFKSHINYLNDLKNNDYNEKAKTKSIETILKLKEYNKKLKSKYTKAINDLNKNIQNKSELENYLKNCFMSVSNDIMKRSNIQLNNKNKNINNNSKVKLPSINKNYKDLTISINKNTLTNVELSNKNINNNAKHISNTNISDYNKIIFDKFTTKDKESVLIKFLFNTDVVNLLQELIFKKTKTNLDICPLSTKVSFNRQLNSTGYSTFYKSKIISNYDCKDNYSKTKYNFNNNNNY